MNTFAPAPNSVQIPVGDDIRQRAALWYDLCTRNKKRIRIMKRPAYDKEALRENKGGMQVAFRRSAADSGNHAHPDHAGRHFRRRPHRPRIRKRNSLPAADRTGRRGGQPLGRQHGEPGLSPEAGQRRRDSPHTDQPDVAGHKKNTPQKRCVSVSGRRTSLRNCTPCPTTGGCRRDRDLQALSEAFRIVRGPRFRASRDRAGGGSSSRYRCSGPCYG